MVETNTLSLVNNLSSEEHSMELFGERFQFDRWLTDIARQNTANPFLNDNVRRGYMGTRLTIDNDFWINRGIGESVTQVSDKHPFVVFVGKPWIRMPNSPESTEHVPVVGSNLHVEGTTLEGWTFPVHKLTTWQQVAADEPERQRLASQLLASFELDSVVDGMEHQAEGIIAEALRSAKDHRVLGWFKAFCTDASQPSFASSILRCLGRQCQGGTGSAAWRVGLVRDGLATNSVEIRDAAIQAAESWGDPELLDVLRTHSEREPWLQQYILDVIDDLAS